MTTTYHNRASESQIEDRDDILLADLSYDDLDIFVRSCGIAVPACTGASAIGLYG